MRRRLAIIGLVMALPMGAQTKISLKTQARGFDLSGLDVVRPFPVSTFLPPTCAVGEVRFKTNVPAGQNLYTCTSANTWTVQGTTSTFDPGFRVARTSATTLSIGADCVASIPCRVRVGSIVYTVAAPSTLTMSSGDGSVFIYLNSAGLLSVALNSPASLSFGASMATFDAVNSVWPAARPLL